MLTFLQSIENWEYHPEHLTWSFKFGDGYELCVETLMFNQQAYIALYKDQSLLTNKIPIKPGKL